MFNPFGGEDSAKGIAERDVPPDAVVFNPRPFGRGRPLLGRNRVGYFRLVNANVKTLPHLIGWCEDCLRVLRGSDLKRWCDGGADVTRPHLARLLQAADKAADRLGLGTTGLADAPAVSRDDLCLWCQRTERAAAVMWLLDTAMPGESNAYIDFPGPHGHDDDLEHGRADERRVAITLRHRLWLWATARAGLTRPMFQRCDPGDRCVPVTLLLLSALSDLHLWIIRAVAYCEAASRRLGVPTPAADLALMADYRGPLTQYRPGHRPLDEAAIAAACRAELWPAVSAAVDWLTVLAGRIVLEEYKETHDTGRAFLMWSDPGGEYELWIQTGDDANGPDDDNGPGVVDRPTAFHVAASYDDAGALRDALAQAFPLSRDYVTVKRAAGMTSGDALLAVESARRCRELAESEAADYDDVRAAPPFERGVWAFVRRLVELERVIYQRIDAGGGDAHAAAEQRPKVPAPPDAVAAVPALRAADVLADVDAVLADGERIVKLRRRFVSACNVAYGGEPTTGRELTPEVRRSEGDYHALHAAMAQRMKRLAAVTDVLGQDNELLIHFCQRPGYWGDPFTSGLRQSLRTLRTRVEVESEKGTTLLAAAGAVCRDTAQTTPATTDAEGPPAFPASHYGRRPVELAADTLRKARDAGRIRGRKVGRVWLYDDADVRREWPERFVAKPAGGSNRPPREAESSGTGRKVSGMGRKAG